MEGVYATYGCRLSFHHLQGIKGYDLNVLTLTIRSVAGSETESDETETEVLAALAIQGPDESRSYVGEELALIKNV